MERDQRVPTPQFLWEGIDGTRIFTHFPSADTYHAHVSAEELLLAEAQFVEKGGTNASLLPFGWGDGGGGPTEEMLASVSRFADLEGAPRVSLSTPSRFFEDATADHQQHAPVWVGELYLERHRGVATTQIPLKRGNRIAERLLREAEYWCTVAAVRCSAAYPAGDLQRVWREVLLLQFHDILPGSSITWVHREAAEKYAALHQELEQIIEGATRKLLGRGDKVARLNAGPFALEGVPALGAAAATDRAPAGGNLATARRSADGGAELDNGRLRVVISPAGEITSLVDLEAGRELVPHGCSAGVLKMYHDTPTAWDAWDLDHHYRDRVVGSDGPVGVSVSGQTVDCATALVTRELGASSSIRIEYQLSADEPRLDITIDLEWHEDQKFLKYVIPLDVHADRAASEVGYGHIFRPTHTNTSWDEAHFETVAHRWLHVGEPGYGVSLANEATYGYSISREVGAGSIASVIGVSLARAPRYPDPESDRGRHHFRFALRPGAGIPEAIAEGYRLNVPIREISNVSSGEVAPLVRIDARGIVVEAVKLADDGSGDVIIRLYQSYGERASGAFTAAFDVGAVTECDLLERPTQTRAELGDLIDGKLKIELRPFQLLTLRITRAGGR